MGIISWCLFGGFSGYWAYAVMPISFAGGRPMAIALGIAGALVGGAAGAWISNRSGISDFDFVSIYLAMIVSLCVLLACRGYALRLEN